MSFGTVSLQIDIYLNLVNWQIKLDSDEKPAKSKEKMIKGVKEIGCNKSTNKILTIDCPRI